MSEGMKEMLVLILDLLISISIPLALGVCCRLGTDQGAAEGL